jgi:hypothetical protein
VWQAVVFVSLIAATGIWIAHGVVGEMPFDFDDLDVLRWATQAHLTTLPGADPFLYPEWRPVAYATVWLQLQATGLSGVVQLQAVNLALWMACAGLAGALVHRVTGAMPGACVTAVVVLTDPRWFWALVWIDDRQTTLACLFGLCAMFIARLDGPRLGRVAQVGLGTLLVAAGLSKEYGLAFALGLAAHALFVRRRDLAAPALASLAVYAALRFALAGGAAAQYCEEMGFFTIRRIVCMDGPAAVPQMAWNVVATLTGSLISGVFDDMGALTQSRLAMLASLPLLAAAAVAWGRRDRTARVAWWLVAGNALLSLMLYRTRNHPVAVIGLAVSGGVGLAYLLEPGASRARRAAGQMLAAVMILVALRHAVTFHRDVEQHRQEVASRRPCREVGRLARIDMAFATRMQVHFAGTSDGCTPATSQ